MPECISIVQLELNNQFYENVKKYNPGLRQTTTYFILVTKTRYRIKRGTRY